MNTTYQPGKLVSLRGRDWIVLPSVDPDLLVVKPLGGSDDEIAGIYLPLNIPADKPQETVFLPPGKDDLGDISTARLLYDSARLAFRNGAGPFRCLAKLSFRPRSYQMVPLIMALRQDSVRLLVADDVGVGKTIEALLIAKELLERRKIQRFAVICLPHLCEQWQNEIRDKLDIEAVIIRSNTQARLDRQIQGDTSVYDYYPFQVISIDFIKSDNRRDVFVEQCPELVIIDEAHTCTRPAGASASQQQRYHLISRLAKKAHQQMILLTATPHSGKPEEFHSLLGLLQPEFETLDLPNSSQNQRRDLARHFIQRKRGDVEKWMGEDTPFPNRDAFEADYSLSLGYRNLFEEMLDFAKQLISVDPGKAGQRKIQYWTALALLRGVMSSPAAGVEMLNTRLSNLATSFDRVLVAPRVSKYVSFIFVPRRQVFHDKLVIISQESYATFAVLQSNIHNYWACRYSSTLGSSTINYAPSDCFETYPFPEELLQKDNPILQAIGERYHEHRRALMLRLWLGLTDIYNLFHNRDLTPAIAAKVSGKPEEAEVGYQGILELRKLHRELDEAVLAAYGWTDLNLGHDFHEVETLPENDRVRYTISPEARKELLKRLLALNHQRAAEEKAKLPAKAEKAGKGKGAKGKKAAADEPGLFG